MTDYFVAPDGHDEPTLWAVTGNQHADPVFRRSDAPKFWPDVVARMTGTTITRDALSALCLSYLKPSEYSGGSWTLNPDALAAAILAALTEGAT